MRSSGLWLVLVAHGTARIDLGLDEEDELGDVVVERVLAEVDADLAGDDGAEPAADVPIAGLHDERYDGLLDVVGVLALDLALDVLPILLAHAHQKEVALLDALGHRLQVHSAQLVVHVGPHCVAARLQPRLDLQASVARLRRRADHQVLALVERQFAQTDARQALLLGHQAPVDEVANALDVVLVVRGRLLEYLIEHGEELLVLEDVGVYVAVEDELRHELEAQLALVGVAQEEDHLEIGAEQVLEEELEAREVVYGQPIHGVQYGEHRDSGLGLVIDVLLVSAPRVLVSIDTDGVYFDHLDLEVLDDTLGGAIEPLVVEVHHALVELVDEDARERAYLVEMLDLVVVGHVHHGHVDVLLHARLDLGDEGERLDGAHVHPGGAELVAALAQHEHVEYDVVDEGKGAGVEDALARVDVLGEEALVAEEGEHGAQAHARLELQAEQDGAHEHFVEYVEEQTEGGREALVGVGCRVRHVDGERALGDVVLVADGVQVLQIVAECFVGVLFAEDVEVDDGQIGLGAEALADEKERLVAGLAVERRRRLAQHVQRSVQARHQTLLVALHPHQRVVHTLAHC